MSGFVLTKELIVLNVWMVLADWQLHRSGFSSEVLLIHHVRRSQNKQLLTLSSCVLDPPDQGGGQTFGLRGHTGFEKLTEGAGSAADAWSVLATHLKSCNVMKP